jgi:hypothetical protein
LLQARAGGGRVMDVFRILLSLGLVVLLWRLDVRGIRPIRNFILWGLDYPFHFLLTATLILVIWGVVGSGFGLQGLFLDEDPLTQVLLGATVMLLFAAITVHYVALGTSRRGWWAAIHRLTTFLRRAATITSTAQPAQAVLANGFLEELSMADIDAIDGAACRFLAAPDAPSTEPRDPLQACLEAAPFRVLIAPAVLLEKGFGLILLVGVVPAILLPVLRREPAACLERLPWLVGVCLGDVLAIILGCKTTAWLARAAGWRDTTTAMLASIRRRAAQLPFPASAAGRQAIGSAAAAHRPAWLRFLLWFFLVHAAVTLLPPATLTSRWIDWPEETVARGGGWPGLVERTRTFPWLPLVVLFGEAAIAAVACGIVALVPRWLGPERLARLTSWWQAVASSGVTLLVRAVGLPGLRPFTVAAAVTLAVASVVATILMQPEATTSAWLGLRGYASLGTMLVCWLAVFWLTTHAAGGRGARTAGEQRAATIALGGLALLHMLGVPGVVMGPLAAVATIISGSRTLAALRPAADLRMAIAGGLAVAAATSLTVAWRHGHSTLAAGVWLGLATLFLGSTALSSLVRRQPAMIYPLTVMLGYLAFALPYAGLGERWQSAMPAAGSIACILALLAAAYTILTFMRPRSAMLSIAAILGTAVLLNGAALFVAPNEFKASFPAMASYYARPVYLDSRDYFRDTTPSTARLRNRVVTEDFDRLAKQGPSERLATVFFSMRPLARRVDGGHAVVLEVDDRLGRLRAAAGDRVRLAAEEWFTIRIDGDDCIALAEEPFYRKIFPWFRYETLHMIRDGIIRGPHAAAYPRGHTPRRATTRRARAGSLPDDHPRRARPAAPGRRDGAAAARSDGSLPGRRRGVCTHLTQLDRSRGDGSARGTPRPLHGGVRAPARRGAARRRAAADDGVVDGALPSRHAAAGRGRVAGGERRLGPRGVGPRTRGRRRLPRARRRPCRVAGARGGVSRRWRGGRRRGSRVRAAPPHGRRDRAIDRRHTGVIPLRPRAEDGRRGSPVHAPRRPRSRPVRQPRRRDRAVGCGAAGGVRPHDRSRDLQRRATPHR